MRCRRFKQVLVLRLALAAGCAGAALASAQIPRDAVECARADLKADRKAVIAEEMRFTPRESDAFWPIYRNYRAEVERVTDRMVNLVFEYSDFYPDVPEQKAKQILKDYTKVEADLLGVKRKYLKKFGKVLPATKVFRLAQLDNRFDLGTRLALAAWIPVMPAPQAQPTEVQR